MYQPIVILVIISARKHTQFTAEQHILGPLCISEFFVIRARVLLEEWVLLHVHEAIDVWENNLDADIVVGNVCKLRVVQLSHERPSLAGVVRLGPLAI